MAEHRPIIVVDARPAGALFKAIIISLIRAQPDPVEQFEWAKIAHCCGQLTDSELKEYEVLQ